MASSCRVHFCTQPTTSRSLYCPHHATRHRRHGDPLGRALHELAQAGDGSPGTDPGRRLARRFRARDPGVAAVVQDLRIHERLLDRLELPVLDEEPEREARGDPEAREGERAPPGR